jgi:hypothetical protein
MKPFELQKKTGFINVKPLNHVVIHDFRGLPFYSTKNLSKPVKEFNLPEGKYFLVEGEIKKRYKPVMYRLAVLPVPQRNLKAPFDFKIQFTANPNKCTIIWNQKTIVFDNSFKSKLLPELWFVLFHEFSHSRYTDEHLADLEASNLMKIRGFNPSQIGNSQLQTLSSNQYNRKHFLIKNIIKYK